VDGVKQEHVAFYFLERSLIQNKTQAAAQYQLTHSHG
jgi:hypothetical protein